MACYHHILVAVDGSPDAEAALCHAVTLARDQHARLTLLTVAPPVATAVGVAPPPDLIDLHTEVLREAAASLPADVGVTTRLERGETAETILRVAEEGPHDLIVMGSHGHSRFHRALLGSVSERVLKAGSTPVLLMRAGKGAPLPEAPLTAPAPE